MRFILGILLLTTLLACQSGEESKTVLPAKPIAEDFITPLYFGTYTRKEGHVDGKASGIYYGIFEHTSGKIKIKDTIGGIINPSFVALSQDREMLYAASETGGGELFAYRLGEANPLLLGQWPTGAAAPCHIAVDASDRLVLVSNYMGGVVNVFYRDSQDRIHEIQRLQLDREGDTAASHAHAASFSPDNRFVFITDLGKDKIWAFRLDTSALGQLVDRPGSLVLHEEFSLHWQHEGLDRRAGPRHFTFHPNGRFAYVVNELNATVTALAYDAKSGQLSGIQNISTLPEAYTDWNACADIHIHPNGRFLYASNRGHNSIVSYQIGEDGQLNLLGHTPTSGEFPRNFAITPDGQQLLVANQNSDNVVSFDIKPQTGKLDKKQENSVKTPVCIAFY